ncbi:cystatin-like protein [Clarias gariepinus]|uniref:cystatin-like protein n=1 Tax=Clarias gariepinus TaxID=13013 RepID=UPI00234DAFB2|nr:cystatin-like protein [Clarias gariepinus]
MEGALRLLLLAALTLLVSAQTFTNYNNLPESYKPHIDKALKKASSIYGRGHHVAFHSLLNGLKIMDDKWKVNFLVMVTTCTKASTDAYKHRDECNKQKNKTPWIDCLVCKMDNEQELVDCGTVKDVRNGMRTKDREDCKESHTGGNFFLF